MRTSETLSVILIAIIISILSGVVLFGVLEVAPGIGTQLIASAVLVMIVITVSITLVFYLGFRRYMAEKTQKVAIMTLSEDEQSVVRKIMQMGGEVEQVDLWRQLDFSRSKLSALLKNLTEKNVVTKRRHHRTNLLRLTEEFEGR